MPYKTYSQFHVPQSKQELLDKILPMWNGKKTELRQMSVKRLRGIFYRMRNDFYNKAMTK